MNNLLKQNQGNYKLPDSEEVRQGKSGKIMNCSFFTFLMLLSISFMLPFTAQVVHAQEKAELPIRKSFMYENSEREYFIRKPPGFDAKKKYRLLKAVHGGGGNGRNFFLADGIYNNLQERGFGVILVTPSFSNTDFSASRFPRLGEGAFLKQVIKELRREFRLHKKIFLTGYSRGGQFSHRFALRNPKLVKACAPFAAGTWTTPDGKLLIQSVGEVAEPETFLSNPLNTSGVPERLRSMFKTRVAQVAGLQAKRRAKKVPFLVMCGTLDPRFEIAGQFAENLKINGYNVQTHWPRTPHGGRAAYPEEFKKYAQSAVAFFRQVSVGK